MQQTKQEQSKAGQLTPDQSPKPVEGGAPRPGQAHHGDATADVPVSDTGASTNVGLATPHPDGASGHATR